MKKKITQAEFQAVCYADVFEFPLTEKEMERWTIKIQNSKFKIQNSSLISYQEGYYFLEGRDRLIGLRRKREGYSHTKWQIAKKAMHILSFIPTIKLIGVTGSLAMDNSPRDDDIDLLIVTSPNTLWFTRFLATILMDLSGLRRQPETHHIKDRICLNMFLDEDHLEIRERDIFIAHEILQVKPIYDKEDIYQKFLTTNSWVKNYLPNAVKKLQTPVFPVSKKNSVGYRSGGDKTGRSNKTPVYYFDRLFKMMQLWYMRRRRTTEVITDGVIRFHPRDIRNWVLEEYQKRLRLTS